MVAYMGSLSKPTIKSRPPVEAEGGALAALREARDTHLRAVWRAERYIEHHDGSDSRFDLAVDLMESSEARAQEFDRRIPEIENADPSLLMECFRTPSRWNPLP